MKNTYKTMFELALLLAVCSLVFSALVSAVPDGVTVTYVANLTKVASTGTVSNHSIGTMQGGGGIYVQNLTATQQNFRWKGFVGNVSGKYTLDDPSGNTLYDWSIIGSPLGEVYATRTAGTVAWSAIRCSYKNTTEGENKNLNHTGNPADNITATFPGLTHVAFDVGTVTIAANTCNSTKTYVNDSSPAAAVFQEVVLYDGGASVTLNDSQSLMNTTNIVYATVIAQDVSGFDGKTYDFQMIVPEIGLAAWTSSTAYYFYVELT